MHYRKMNCPIGELLLVGTEDMLELIGFPEGKGVVQIQSDWQEDGTAFADAAQQLDEYFAGRRKVFDLNLKIS